MKKHIIGLALFSFIVITAGFVYSMFSVARVEEVFVVTNSETYSPTKSCWKMKRDSKQSSVGDIKVKQAVFDLKTKQLNWELAAPLREGSSIALHFFVKNADGTRYLNSALAPQTGFENGVIKATSSYEWLDRLESYENLYVVPELTTWSEFQKRQPKFNAEKATSVLLYSGEQGYLTEKYFRE